MKESNLPTPNDELTKLHSLCDLVSETVKAAESNCERYVGLEHLDSGRFMLKRFASPLEFKSSSNRFQRGDLLYGKLRPYLDKAVIAPWEGVCSTEILVLRPKLLEDIKYLIALLHSKDFIDYAQSSADKQFPRTSWNWISKYSFYLPEPSTRRKAGSLIWALQEAIELETEKISCLKEISEGVLERLASQELLASFNKMDSLHDEISKGWEQ